VLTGRGGPGEPGGAVSGPVPGPLPGAGQLIMLVTSPRVAPGLLTLQAWDALRGAARVLCGSPGHPQLPALAEAGITCQIVGGPLSDAALAQILADAAAQADGPVVWLAGGPARRGLGLGLGTGTGPGTANGTQTTATGTSEDVGPAAGQDAGALLSSLHELGPRGPATVVLHGSADLPGGRLLDLVATMEILRAECPWDAKQTHESLAPHLLEEPYEALEALESGDYGALREELGDVLLQVVFHAKVASERRDGTGYTVDDIADGIVAKLVRRHPHVFADVAVSGAEEVKQNWDAIKKAERSQKASPGDAPSSALDGVPFGQPALALAAQLQRRAERAGVPVEMLGVARVDGRPMPDAGDDPAAPDAAAGIGDSLFAMAAVARAAGLDPEMELRSAARRFGERVRAWEQTRPDSLPERTGA
jgi:XTP/dITP diphosphohydrolase